MFSWYILALFSLACQGGKTFLYKVSAEKKCNAAWANFSMVVTVFVLSTISFFVSSEKIFNWQLLLGLSLVGGIAYAVNTITGIESLKHIPASVSFPIRRLSGVIVVIFSVVYFQDSFSSNQILGIITAILVTLIVTKQYKEENNEDKNFKKGLFLAFIALFFSSIAAVIPKFAALTLGTLSYMMVTYFVNSAFSFSLTKRMQGRHENKNQKNALLIGLFMGLLNFFGFYSYIIALQTGPLSLVFLIQSFSFLLAIFLSVLFYKEKVTFRRALGVLLAIAAVILMRN